MGKYRKAATQYTLETWFVSKYICKFYALKVTTTTKTTTTTTTNNNNDNNNNRPGR